jgi:hypothetical protein
VTGHTVLALTATAAGLVTGGAYCWQAATRPGKAPHLVKWSCITVLAALACAVQVNAGAGIAALVLAAATLTNGVNVVTALRKRGARDLSPSALACATVAALAAAVWLGADDPTVAAVFLSLGSVAAMGPTVVRTWREPQMEVQRTYWWNTGRYALAVAAVPHPTVATVLYPATWVAINAAFSVYHAVRLRRVHAPSEPHFDAWSAT